MTDLYAWTLYIVFNSEGTWYAAMVQRTSLSMPEALTNIRRVALGLSQAATEAEALANAQGREAELAEKANRQYDDLEAIG